MLKNASEESFLVAAVLCQKPIELLCQTEVVFLIYLLLVLAVAGSPELDGTLLLLGITSDGYPSNIGVARSKKTTKLPTLGVLRLFLVLESAPLLLFGPLISRRSHIGVPLPLIGGGGRLIGVGRLIRIQGAQV